MGMTLADATADLSSLILLSIKLHIFLSFFEWWAFQESDTVSVLWYHVWAVFFEKTRCVLSKVGALVLLRFPTCLVNGAVFLDTPDCVFSGRSLENGTIDQLFPLIGGCSFSRVPVAVNVTFCATGFPEPSDVSFVRFSVRMILPIAAIWRQFWTSSVHALNQVNISGLPVLGTLTSVPALPSSLKIFFLWSAQFCFWDKFYEVIGHLQHWLVCQLLHKVCWAIQRCFVQASFDGAPRCWRFLRNLHFWQSR